MQDKVAKNRAVELNQLLKKEKESNDDLTG